ncbi:MAG: HD domain-containing protein [Fluviibacter phosphoraccumulans]
MFDQKFSEALSLATQAHAGQIRKGTKIPYVSHVLAVASIVIEFGGDQEQAIAALLHDALEDVGPHYRELISKKFGERVLRIVEACTDGIPDQSGQKAPWEIRKSAYLEHLRYVEKDSLLVSASDKLSNACSIRDDLLDPDVGIAVFERFSVPQDRTIWYYESLAMVYLERGCPVAFKLCSVVAQIKALASI